MARRCEVCGRRLVTGRKYCYEHRHTRTSSSRDVTPIFVLFLIIIAIYLIYQIISQIYLWMSNNLIIVSIVLIGFSVYVFVWWKYGKASIIEARDILQDIEIFSFSLLTIIAIAYGLFLVAYLTLLPTVANLVIMIGGISSIVLLFWKWKKQKKAIQVEPNKDKFIISNRTLLSFFIIIVSIVFVSAIMVFVLSSSGKATGLSSEGVTTTTISPENACIKALSVDLPTFDNGVVSTKIRNKDDKITLSGFEFTIAYVDAQGQPIISPKKYTASQGGSTDPLPPLTETQFIVNTNDLTKPSYLTVRTSNCEINVGITWL